MPGTATEQADPETGVHNFLVTDGEQRWVAGYLSLPPELQSIPALQLLAQAQDGFVRIMPNSKLVSSSQARVGGFPAITCVIEAQAPDRPPFKLKMSAVVAKGRLFTFGFISRKDAFVESEVNKYLETFRVK